MPPGRRFKVLFELDRKKYDYNFIPVQIIKKNGEKIKGNFVNKVYGRLMWETAPAMVTYLKKKGYSAAFINDIDYIEVDLRGFDRRGLDTDFYKTGRILNNNKKYKDYLKKRGYKSNEIIKLKENKNAESGQVRSTPKIKGNKDKGSAKENKR